MAASYESVRHDRRYEVNSSGIAEFGLDGFLRQFIPWSDVTQIKFGHDQKHKVIQWCVRAADGSAISPMLEYANSLECCHDAARAWRRRMPHACRSQFARVYRKVWWRAGLIHLLWVIPALFVYGVSGPAYALRLEIPWDAIGRMSLLIALMYVVCVLHNLLYRKVLRLGFDRWYALVEANIAEPTPAARVSSFAIVRWMFPAPPAHEPITDEEHHWFLSGSSGQLSSNHDVSERLAQGCGSFVSAVETRM